MGLDGLLRGMEEVIIRRICLNRGGSPLDFEILWYGKVSLNGKWLDEENRYVKVRVFSILPYINLTFSVV